jgi:hypothetical protein
MKTRSRHLGRADGVNVTETDREAVPGVDHPDRDRELDQLLRRELSLRLGVDLVRGVRLGDSRPRPGPAKRDLLARL